MPVMSAFFAIVSRKLRQAAAAMQADKQIRQRCWAQLEAPSSGPGGGGGESPQGKPRDAAASIVRACQPNGTGKSRVKRAASNLSLAERQRRLFVFATPEAAAVVPAFAARKKSKKLLAFKRLISMIAAHWTNLPANIGRLGSWTFGVYGRGTTCGVRVRSKRR